MYHGHGNCHGTHISGTIAALNNGIHNVIELVSGATVFGRSQSVFFETF